MKSANETELLGLAQFGDNQAFDQLMHRYRPKLRCFLAQRFSSVDTDDALQETLFRAWRELAGFRSQSSLLSWFYGIAKDTGNNMTNKHSARMLRDACSIDTGSRNDFVVQMPDSSSPDLELEAKQTVSRIARKLSKMSKTLADTLVQFSWNERSYEQIAKDQVVPVGTVCSRIHRARIAAGLPPSSRPHKS